MYTSRDRNRVIKYIESKFRFAFATVFAIAFYGNVFIFVVVSVFPSQGFIQHVILPVLAV